MSLDEEKKKAIIAAQRQPLVRVTRNPTTRASRAPEELNDFFLNPHTAIAEGRRMDTISLKGVTAIVYQVSRESHVVSDSPYVVMVTYHIPKQNAGQEEEG